MQKFALFLGCNIPFKAPDIEQSIRQVCPPLGIEPLDMVGASCCPAWGTAPSFDKGTWCALSCRNMAIAEEMGVDIMTGCNSCFGILSEAKHFMHDPEVAEEAHELLAHTGREYKGTSDIHHITHVLHEHVGAEKIAAALRYSQNGVTVAVQTGCHILWPTEVMTLREANPFFPRMLKDLVEATGASAPHYSRIEGCCGMGGMRTTNAEKSMRILGAKMRSMKEEIDPDVIVTGCSSCYMQFDQSQETLRKMGEIDFEIPVLYYTQFLALAMGFDPKEVAAISAMDRSGIIEKIQNPARAVQPVTGAGSGALAGTGKEARI